MMLLGRWLALLIERSGRMCNAASQGDQGYGVLGSDDCK